MFIPAMKQYLWGIAITVVIVFVLVRKHSDSLFENIGNFKKGKRGEDEVAAMLKENLDDNYTCVENYMIPNARIGDIDGLLIGPKGVVILEVKNYQGVFRISGPDLYRRNRGDKIILCIKKVLSFKQLGRKIIFLNILKIRALAMYL